MIIKELDPFVDRGDVFARTGHQAEKQMAFYLQRAFGQNESVHVFNNLRLERNGDFAQIDHLIVHRAGMVLIESKSVHGTVRVNEQGEWMRVFGRHRQGMASPIEQANRQAQFLKEFLNDHAPQIATKFLGVFQTYFGFFPRDVVVAVSDTGIIERPKKRELPEVCKADQAVTKVEELLARQKRESGWFTSDASKGGRTINASELSKMLTLLSDSHSPLLPTATAVPDNSDLPPTQAFPVPAEAATPAQNQNRSSNRLGCLCATCQKPLTPKEEAYCREHAKRFDEAFYCYRHQRTRLHPKMGA